MQEINGFEIEQYNIHSLIEGKKLQPCPLCSPERKKKTEPCLMVDWERGLGTCQHCGEVIQLHKFKRQNDTKEYEKPPKYNYKTDYSENLVKWFKENRGISRNTLERLKITEGIEWMPQTKKEENCIKFNYYIGEELINIKYRDGRKNFKLYKGAEKVFYNLNSIFGSDEAIIVEGEIDVASLTEADRPNVVSVPNGATKGNINLDYLDNCYQFFEGKNKIIIATDNDENGNNLKKELIRRLGAERCYTVDFGKYNDPNQVLTEGGVLELQELIDNAVAVPLEDVETLSDHRKELHDFFIKGAPKGFKIGLKDFDDIFSTYTGQYIAVTGIPGSGKSDFVDQMVVGYNLNYNWKIAMCSVENRPSYLHSDKILRKIGGYRPRNQQEIDTEKWRMIESHVESNFFNVTFELGYELESVLDKIKELIFRKGIKCFVLDPFNKIRYKKGDERFITEYTNDYLSIIDNFCRKHDVLGIVVAHPVKQKPGDQITLYSIKGGGEWYDMTPHGLLVERDYARNLVKIKVLKCKFSHLGTNYAETYFGWNFKNGRYTKVLTDTSNEFLKVHEFEIDNTNWLTKLPIEDNQTDIFETIEKPLEFGKTDTTDLPF
jgi:twinkle protein